MNNTVMNNVSTEFLTDNVSKRNVAMDKLLWIISIMGANQRLPTEILGRLLEQAGLALPMSVL